MCEVMTGFAAHRGITVIELVADEAEISNGVVEIIQGRLGGRKVLALMVAVAGVASLDRYLGASCADFSMQIIHGIDLLSHTLMAVQAQAGLIRRKWLMAAAAFGLKVCM